MISQDRTIAVTVREHAFGTARQFRVNEGSTFAAIVVLADLSDVQQNVVGIFLNDHLIDPKVWHCAKPKASDRYGHPVHILLVPIPKGGNNSRKIIAQSIMFAAIAAAAIVSGGTLLPALGPLTAAQVSALGAAGIVAAGSLTAQFVAPPPITPKDRKQIEASSAGIAANQLAPNENLQAVFGFARISPNLIAPPFMQFHDDRLRALACFGVAGRYAVPVAGDILVNGIDIDNFDDADYELQRGLTSDGAMSHDAAGCGVQQGGAELTSFVLDPDAGSGSPALRNQSDPDGDKPQWQYFISSGTCTQFRFQISWPGGIVRTEDGSIAAVPVRIEFRRKGSPTWLKCPVLHFKDNRLGGFLRQEVQVIFASGGTSGEEPDYPCFLASRTTSPGKSWVYNAEAYFDNGVDDIADNVTLTQDGAMIFLETATYPLDAYEFRIMRGAVFKEANFEYAGSTYTYNADANFANFFDYFNDSGTFKVRIDQTQYQSTTLVERVVTLDDVNPPFSLPAGSQVWKMAIGVVDKTVDSLSVMLRSEFPVWDGSDWDTIVATNNPAALCRAIIVGSNLLNARPPGLSKIEDDVFEAWFDHCVDQELACNLIWENGGTAEALLATIAACGSARLVRRPKWAPIIEYDRSSEDPTQTITGLNSSGMSVTKPFSDPPHAWRVEYRDEADDFREKNVIVYAPGFTIANSNRIDSVRFDGVTNEDGVVVLATRALRQIYFRPQTYSTNMPLQSVWMKPGDLVATNHDVIFSGHQQARIRQVNLSGGEVISIEMEEPINIANIIEMANGLDDIEILDPVSAAGAIIKLSDGTSITTEVAQGVDEHTIDIVNPFADPGSVMLKEGCEVGFGGLGKEYRRMIVTQISPAQRKQALVTLVDEAQEIHD